jgi:hypothetical protein
MKSIWNTDKVANRVKDAASSARVSFIDLGTQVLRLVNNLRDGDRQRFDSVLGRVGLYRRRGNGALGPVLWFTAGAVVGGGAGILLAPSVGQGVRDRLSRLVGQLDSYGRKASAKGDGVVAAVKQVDNGELR